MRLKLCWKQRLQSSKQRSPSCSVPCGRVLFVLASVDARRCSRRQWSLVSREPLAPVPGCWPSTISLYGERQQPVSCHLLLIYPRLIHSGLRQQFKRALLVFFASFN